VFFPVIVQNPQIALPGVVAAVNRGDINLDDYDISNEAKEQIQGLAD